MEALDSLNEPQKEAATHIDGALLILAGAGSGKTKTITTRLAYLLSVVGIPPQNTLTLTFTNKAAKEMRDRAMNLISSNLISSSLIGNNPMSSTLTNGTLPNNTAAFTDYSPMPLMSMPLLCTFHKFGLLFLQRYMPVLSRSSVFNVIDEDDKRKIIRNLKKTHKDMTLTPSSISESISRYKNNAIMPAMLQTSGMMIENAMAALYQAYEEYLCANSLVDFDDLLLLPYRILSENEEVRNKVSAQYQYIMVDEYQDTNNLQASLLSLLCNGHENLCVVGDDDQSIYSWRGANIANILEFGEQFSETKIVKLEYNYRSSEQILRVANDLIAHNTERYNKVLKATKSEGKQVRYIKSLTDKLEMAQIIESIQELVNQGAHYDDIAILFRLNALARNVEECLNRAKIPFQMLGVVRFYERQEIKDVLAYLRLALNPHDNFSLERVINRPRRGIGEKGFTDIQAASRGYASIYDAWKQGALQRLKITSKIQEFFELIESLQECLLFMPKEVALFFVSKVRLYADDTPSKDSENNEERRENMAEFFAAMRDFIEECEERGSFADNREMIQSFLNDVALSSSADSHESGMLSCMSVHNSKGLEFAHVFVIGMEQGLFPLYSFDEMGGASQQIDNLDEERRLAYVAFTRAKESLTLCYTKTRMYRNMRRDFEPSQFLIESGVVSSSEAGFHESVLLDSEDLSSGGSADSSGETSLKKGDCVQHKIFGFGRIESVQGSGEVSRATINFGGTRRIILTSFLTKT